MTRDEPAAGSGLLPCRFDPSTNGACDANEAMPVTRLPTKPWPAARAAVFALVLALAGPMPLAAAPGGEQPAIAANAAANPAAGPAANPATNAARRDSPASAAPVVPSRRALRAQVQPGELPPDFLGLDRDGRPVKVSDYRGKLVVLSFWASWCGPCRRELPMLAALQAGVGREHLRVVAINLNEPQRDFDAFLKLNPGLGELGHIRDTGAVARHYGITAVPNLFVIDQAGRIAKVHRGYSPQQLRQFAEEIAALLPAEALKRPAE